MRKFACYLMTRNYYKNIFPSLKSLLCNSDVDKVYLLIEDDDIGFELPERVECRNISGQTWFHEGGPNYGTGWSWVVLMRAALTKLFPDMDRILSIDVDTLVVGDISKLWDTPMGRNYVAGALDLPLVTNDNIYINGGVMLLNLDQLRKDGMDDKLIDALNTRKFAYPEQDCINHLCEGRIYLLNGIYNSGVMNYDGTTPRSRDNGTPKILHFAGRGLKNYFADPRVQEYKDIPWEDCEYGRFQRKKVTGVPVKKSKDFTLCGACGTVLIVPQQKYCHECGKPVKW